ncbi:MarR family transcriptional regulator [Escherichia coli]|nr:MarR family transcriptional regulator [Escherichia coli]MCZ5779346.1 MarR family transcriptional regulator [Escherichia coli]
MGEISVKTGNNARNGGKNSLNRLIRCVCGKKIGPDPRNFNQRVSLGRNDLLIRTFLRVNDKIQSIIENELSEYRINTSTFMVLVSLYMSDDYCQSPSDIYKELQFSKTNITHIIDKLEKKNIAKRINNKNDRRSKSICLTPDGVTLAQKLINTQNVMLKKIWSGLSDDEMKTFELANKKLLSNLNVN